MAVRGGDKNSCQKWEATLGFHLPLVLLLFFQLKWNHVAIMVRRISSSQLRGKLQQVQSKIRQAQSKQRQAISSYNQAVRSYNSKARVHNARVRASRDRLRRELQKLSRSTTPPRFQRFSASVSSLQRSYVSLEARAEANAYDDSYNAILDLSEREAANSVSVLNVLQGETSEAIEDQTFETDIDEILEKISQDVRDRWGGALFALSPDNPDAARHFCTSARELLTEILNRFAKDDEVKSLLPNCDLTQQGTPTRRSKTQFFFRRHGVDDDALTSFVESDLQNVVDLFHVFNSGTHGSSGRYEHGQLVSIRYRVEGAVKFLWSIISGNAFAEG